MRRFLVGLGSVLGVLLVLGAVLFLVGYEIWRSFDLSRVITGPLDEAHVQRVIQGVPEARADEIQHFSLFITVGNGHQPVVTGVQFTSTVDPKIDHQWCYIRRNGGPGETFVSLTLADQFGAGPGRPKTLTDPALAEFGLSRAEAKALIESHCRFREHD